jgi:hypothetical protein
MAFFQFEDAKARTCSLGQCFGPAKVQSALGALGMVSSKPFRILDEALGGRGASKIGRSGDRKGENLYH